LKLGEANPDNSGDDFRVNDDIPLTAGELDIPGWNVVDMVSAGADPNGGTDTDVVSIIEQEWASGTMMAFPPGDYYVESEFKETNVSGLAQGDTWSDVSIVGMGGSESVTFFTDSNTSTPRQQVFNIRGNSNLGGNPTQGYGLRVEGIGIDATGQAQSNRCTIGTIAAMDRLHVEDLSMSGVISHSNSLLKTGLGLTEGYGVVRWIRGTDGVVANDNTSSTGVFLGGNHDGQMLVDGVRLEHWTDNGVRHSATGSGTGRIHVTNSYIRNVSKNGIRVGEHGSTAHNCYLVGDSNFRHGSVGSFRPLALGYGQNLAIRDCYVDVSTTDIGALISDAGSSDYDTGVIENVHVNCSSAVDGSGSLISFSTPGTGTLTVRNVHTTAPAGSYGTFRCKGSNIVLEDCYADVQGEGTRIDSGGVEIRGGRFNGSPAIDTGWSQTTSGGILIDGVEEVNGGIDANQGNADDVNLVNMEEVTGSLGLNPNNFTRPRWNGVIGGGPWGGVDLSTTTGQFDGDLAQGDGTSSASNYSMAIWDSANTRWQYFDPTGTV